MMTDNIKVMLLNVNGLTTPMKRETVMTKLKKEQAQIIFLQETHLSQLEPGKLKRYGYRNLYYSSYKEGRRRGVVTLSNTTQFDYETEFKYKGGYITVKGRLKNEPITLINVYAPPESNKYFFKSLFDVIAGEIEEILICRGDLNVVMNHSMDIRVSKEKKMQLTRSINMPLKEMGMIDIWRNLHPLEKDFTHYSAAHKVHSRVEIFFL